MLESVEVLVEDVDLLPEVMKPGSAGFDLRVNSPSSITLFPGIPELVGTGVKIWIKDPHYAAGLISRSSLGKVVVSLANSFGLLDSDYQGELKLNMLNNGDVPVIINPKERVAQIFFFKVERPKLKVLSGFTGSSERGEGGHGSTGRF